MFLAQIIIYKMRGRPEGQPLIYQNLYLGLFAEFGSKELPVETGDMVY